MVTLMLAGLLIDIHRKKVYHNKIGIVIIGRGFDESFAIYLSYQFNINSIYTLTVKKLI